MKYNVTVRASLLLSPDVCIVPAQILEVSLDCYLCNRRHRTVVMRKGERSYCTPTHHSHSAQILHSEISVRNERTDIIYRFNYDFKCFWDLKYKTVASDQLSWGRISFTVTCPQCGEIHDQSTQQNLVRPFQYFCDCGHLLYLDDQEMPVFDEVAQHHSGLYQPRRDK